MQEKIPLLQVLQNQLNLSSIRTKKSWVDFERLKSCKKVWLRLKGTLSGVIYKILAGIFYLNWVFPAFIDVV